MALEPYTQMKPSFDVARFGVVVVATKPCGPV